MWTLGLTGELKLKVFTVILKLLRDKVVNSVMKAIVLLLGKDLNQQTSKPANQR